METINLAQGVHWYMDRGHIPDFLRPRWTARAQVGRLCLVKIVADYNKCQGLGMCESLAPDYFEVADNGDLMIHSELVADGDLQDVREAVASCPTESLSLVEE